MARPEGNSVRTAVIGRHDEMALFCEVTDGDLRDAAADPGKYAAVECASCRETNETGLLLAIRTARSLFCVGALWDEVETVLCFGWDGDRACDAVAVLADAGVEILRCDSDPALVHGVLPISDMVIDDGSTGGYRACVWNGELGANVRSKLIDALASHAAKRYRNALSGNRFRSYATYDGIFGKLAVLSNGLIGIDGIEPADLRAADHGYGDPGADGSGGYIGFANACRLGNDLIIGEGAVPFAGMAERIGDDAGALACIVRACVSDPRGDGNPAEWFELLEDGEAARVFEEAGGLSMLAAYLDGIPLEDIIGTSDPGASERLPAVYRRCCLPYAADYIQEMSGTYGFS